MSKPLSLISAAFIAGSVSANAAMNFPFTHPDNAYHPIDYLDGSEGTQWTALGKTGSDGIVTDFSAETPNGSTGSVRQIGIGSDYGVGGSAGGQRGYLFSIADGTNNYFTPYFTFASHTTTAVNWIMGNSDGTNVRLLVQSAGTWYASQTFYNTTQMNLDALKAGGTSFSVTLSDATWFTYDMTTLTVDTGTNVTILPTYDLTGVGFHTLSFNDNSLLRMDNLSVIPEPSSAMLALPCFLPLLFRRRSLRR